MTQANNEPAKPTAAELREQLRQTRLMNRLNAEKLRGKPLEKRVARMEAAGDWTVGYMDMLDRYRRLPEHMPLGLGPFADRLSGRNWPIYQNETELGLLRAPARVLAATNNYAQGFIEGLTSYVIGSGFQYRVSAKKNKDVSPNILDACQQVIDDFVERSEWFGGELPNLEEEQFQRTIEDGESFLVHFPQDDGTTEVRVVEPEQIKLPTGIPVTDWLSEQESKQIDWLFGVGTPKGDVQRPLAYWVQWEASGEGVCYHADQITHIRRNVKRSMKRGLPDFTFDTYDSLQLAGNLRSSMTDAAAQQAAIVGVTQYASASQAEVQDWLNGDADRAVTDPTTGKTNNVKYQRRGNWEHIPEGQQYVPPPSAVNGPVHIQILQACLRSAGLRWNAPEWMTGDASNNNYASSLTAESPFVRTVIRRQKTYTAAYRRTMLIVLANWAKAGRLVVKGVTLSWERIKEMVDVIVTAPSPETRNTMLLAQQAAIEIPLGTDSRQRVAESLGRDFQQIKQDNEEYNEEVGIGGATLPLPPEPNGAPQ